MKDHSIKFNFIENRFSYELPLLGVDLDFIKQRKSEVLDCMQQLSKKCGEINIASSAGVAEFNRANKLVSYYFDALCKLNHKERQLSGGDIALTQEQQLQHSVRMREFYRERTK